MAKARPELIIRGFGLEYVKSKFYNFGEDEPDETGDIGTSYLGTPVFSSLDILGGTYTNLEGEEINYPDIYIDTVLYTVSQNKNIVKTAMQGRNGTVKEYISDGDYNITIRGVIWDDSRSAEKYPKANVVDFLKVCKAQADIKIASRFLDLFDITNIVITSYRLPEKEGTQNAQLFEINAISDDPIELTIRER